MALSTLNSVSEQLSTPGAGESARGHLPGSHRIGGYRWKICALLFFATTLNYMDRQVLALLKPTLQDPIHGIGLTEVQFASIVSIFSAAYALGLLVAGRFVDKVGTRIGYAVAVAIWTIASISHSLAAVPAVTRLLAHGAGAASVGLRAVPGLGSAHWVEALGKLSGAVIAFGMARFLLGFGEAGNFPAAVKAVAEWFPRKERALATGIFNAGTNIGATLAPFAIGFLVLRLSWRYAFLSTSAFALIWLVLWLVNYRAPDRNPKVSEAELLYIRGDQPEASAKISWAKLIPHRQTWAFVAGKVLTDPIWWFYLYWLPGFLNARYGLTLTKMGLPLLVIYNVCTVGSVFGGWLPAQFVAWGWSINRARKTAMLIYALAITPIMLIGHTHTMWQAVALISLATAAHQAWSANLFTLASDMFPRYAVGSVVGIGACGGSVAMMFFGLFVGFMLRFTHGNYGSLFFVAGTAYLFAIALIQLLVPRLRCADLGPAGGLPADS